MKMFVKKFDHTTKRCIDIAEYTNSPDYTLQEVEIYKGKYYLQGYAPKKTLVDAKAEKLSELNAAFSVELTKTHCSSSTGLEINADETAMRNVEGLIHVMAQGESTVFRSYDNSFHRVSREQLEVIKKEIIINTQKLYQRKWELEAAIEAAATVDELNVVTITFETIEKPEEESNRQTAWLNRITVH